MLNAVTKDRGGDWGTDEEILRTGGHPGLLLAKLMEKYDLALWQVADGAGLSRPLVSAIKNQNRRVSPATATKLGRFFEHPPELWTNAQSRYDLEKLSKEN